MRRVLDGRVARDERESYLRLYEPAKRNIRAEPLTRTVREAVQEARRRREARD